MAAAFEISHEWEEPDKLHELLQKIREQRDDADIKRIRYAYYLAEQAHAGQTRRSGEPYIEHPLAVTAILVDLRMDDDTLIAALLHDVVEDCPGEIAQSIPTVFGEDVAMLVDGVTKLKLLGSGDLSPRQRAAAETARTAESLRKMLLAMAKDFRVMVIKLADRLHNMSTLGALPPDKQVRVANETLDIFAPLAGRLGIWQIKWQLEDLAFKFLHPHEYEEVNELVKRSRTERERDLRDAVVSLKDRFEKRGVKIVEVKGRPKHLYSIFNKMVKNGLEFSEIHDLLAMRVIVGSVSDCYVALGLVHELWVPMPGLFYDYIAKPKTNGYQSLHTKVVGPNGATLEVQIRTMEMHEIAEHGIAAHWAYKEGKAALDETARLKQLREQLFDWSSDARTSSDFLRTVSTDLFAEQVFVFTPKGDVLDLPKESTPVDFAFRVHTQLGMNLIGAKINGGIVPLSTPLKNGDVVELITRSNAQPSLNWLEFVKSPHTRSKLRSHFRKLSRDENVARGRDAIDRELRSFGLDPRLYLGEEKVEAVAESIDGCDTADDVFAKVGAGLVNVQGIVSKLRGIVPEQSSSEQIQISRTKEGKVALVAGLDNIMVHRAKCCSPIPGDEVVGYVTRGRGIMIHRKVCPNALNLQATEAERMLPYEWPRNGSSYAVDLKIVAVNRQGLLMDVSTIFAEAKTNVSAARVRTMPNHTAELELTVDVTDTAQLINVMNKISNFSDVISILRMFGRTAGK